MKKNLDRSTITIMIVAAEMMDMHTSRFVEMLLRVGYTVTLVARENPYSEAVARFKFIHYPKFFLPDWFRPYRLRVFLKDWIPALYLKNIWRKVKPNVVHNIYIGDGAYCSALAGLSPLVLTALGSDINDVFEMGTLDQRSRIAKALLFASHITADTNEVLNRCKLLSGKLLNLRLFYFGIDLNLFYPRPLDEKLLLRKKLGIPAGSRIILSPRRITPKMQHDTVLKAFKVLKEKSEIEMVLIFRRFGSFSTMFEDEMRKLVEELGISDAVVWLDKMDYKEIPVLYSLADVVINVPEQDGLPVTLLEVSACKTPVVTSDLPSYREFLSDSAYVCVRSGDVDGIVTAIQMILTKSREQLAEDLEKNYNLILQRAEQTKCSSVMENIYQEAQTLVL